MFIPEVSEFYRTTAAFDALRFGSTRKTLRRGKDDVLDMGAAL